jgi:hypothetical protein
VDSGGHGRTVAELVERARRYPFEQPTGSFVFTHGRLYPVPHPCGPWTPDLEVAEADDTIPFAEVCARAGADPDYAGASRTPVFGYSSNSSPDGLAHKFALLRHVAIPVLRCQVTGWDAVYSCHFSRGYVPGAIHPSPGTVLSGTIAWLTDEELDLMHASERLGTNYELRPLEGSVAEFEDGQTRSEPLAYHTLHGELRINDLPVAVDGVTAENRRYGVMKELELLELAHAEIDPDRPLDEMIAAAVESFEVQEELTERLKACHFTTPGGIPEPGERPAGA